MLLEKLENLDESYFLKLCDDGCPESETLEFKRDLPLQKNTKHRNNFLTDVCALANVNGGDIVYGIDEKNGLADSLNPINPETESADAAMRRLGQILDAGLEPRHQGIRFYPIQLTEGFILVLRVPLSFNGPHRYLFDSTSKFVMRNGTHNTDLTYDQLRLAFDRTATLADRARRFRDDRLKSIINNDIWSRELLSSPFCVVHLIPIASMSGQSSLDMQSLYSEFNRFTFATWFGASRKLNLEGLFVYAPLDRHSSQICGYSQIFRSGSLEALSCCGALHDKHKYIPSHNVADFVREAISKFIYEAQSCKFSGPAIVGAALLGVRGWDFDHSEADRDYLILPETWLDNLESVDNPDSVIRPVLDVMWQCFGKNKCSRFDENGTWK